MPIETPETAALFAALDTPTLLDLRSAFEVDRALEYADTRSVAMCTQRIDLIDTELARRGVQWRDDRQRDP